VCALKGGEEIDASVPSASGSISEKWRESSLVKGGNALQEGNTCLPSAKDGGGSEVSISKFVRIALTLH